MSNYHNYFPESIFNVSMAEEDTAPYVEEIKEYIDSITLNELANIVSYERFFELLEAQNKNFSSIKMKEMRAIVKYTIKKINGIISSIRNEDNIYDLNTLKHSLYCYLDGY